MQGGAQFTGRRSCTLRRALGVTKFGTARFRPRNTERVLKAKATSNSKAEWRENLGGPKTQESKWLRSELIPQKHEAQLFERT